MAAATRPADPSPSSAGPPGPRPARARPARPRVDAVCAEAVDLARQAALEEAQDAADVGQVGEHEGVTADGDRLVTHYFASLNPAYRGWRWAVTVARAPRSRTVTVAEVVLLPGAEALLPPEWVPWSERLRPGDLGVGDLLPSEADDERLAPGYTVLGEDADVAGGDLLLGWELGLGRARVLSAEGREESADRWYAGAAGPQAPIAAAAPGQCSTCGFFLPLAGSLRRAFGVCANEYAPDDARVVSVDHGCGAHSEAAVAGRSAGAEAAETGPLVDELGYDVLTMRDGPAELAELAELDEPDAQPPVEQSDQQSDERPDGEPDQEPDGHSGGSVDPTEPGEELGHS